MDFDVVTRCKRGVIENTLVLLPDADVSDIGEDGVEMDVSSEDDAVSEESNAEEENVAINVVCGSWHKATQ